MNKINTMGNSLYVLLTLLVGFCFPVMAASNSTLAKSLGNPLVGTMIVFQMAVFLLLIITMLTRSPVPSLRDCLQVDWKVWLGGCIVVLNLLIFSTVPRRIGIANMVVLFTAGQLLSSVLAENFGLLRFPVHAINWQRVVGLVLLIAGVVLIKKF
jgi:bacterial/archaeal transporter family-2 protein